MTEDVSSTLAPLSGPTGSRLAVHRSEVRDVLRRRGITNTRVFGSVARGDDHDGSDLDLLVDFPPDTSIPDTSILDILDTQDELESLLGVAVDLVPARGLKDRVRASAEKDLIPL